MHAEAARSSRSGTGAGLMAGRPRGGAGPPGTGARRTGRACSCWTIWKPACSAAARTALAGPRPAGRAGRRRPPPPRARLRRPPRSGRPAGTDRGGDRGRRAGGTGAPCPCTRPGPAASRAPDPGPEGTRVIRRVPPATPRDTRPPAARRSRPAPARPARERGTRPRAARPRAPDRGPRRPGPQRAGGGLPCLPGGSAVAVRLTSPAR